MDGVLRITSRVVAGNAHSAAAGLSIAAKADVPRPPEPTVNRKETVDRTARSQCLRGYKRGLFPDLAIDVVGGRTLAIPRDLAGSYAVVLFYRGSWCPYGCAQLAAFSRGASALRPPALRS